MELDEEIEEQIQDLAERGNELMEGHRNVDAINTFEEALGLLPRPVMQWDEAMWLYASIGDAYYARREFCDAVESLRIALSCPGGIENPFVQLRLGESLYRMGFAEQAAQHLTIAFMHEGRETFADEPSDICEFLSGQLKQEI